jgi:glycosyltransferase involved in cell wall biosynthesis
MTISLIVVNKDEPSLGDTLDAVGGLVPDTIDEVVVVDASQGRLDWIRVSHPWVRWIDYEQPVGTKITISHQRNVGVRAATGDVVVFTDSGCLPRENWLELLLAPILEEGEHVTCGRAVARDSNVYSGERWWGSSTERYVSGGATINMAFRRSAFDAVGGFDESFGAGEDLDFSWRLIAAGFPIRWVPDAVVEHEWGDLRRQLRRAYIYGVGWARLYRKHPSKFYSSLREYPVPVVYPLFLLGLPLALKYRAYPLLLLVPLWRSRKEDLPLWVLVDHLALGAGVLAECTGLYRRAGRHR